MDPALDARTRLFVSWHIGPRLVGCIGTLSATWTLAEGVPAFALKAGLHDRRTPNPSVDELPSLRCDVSILGPPEPLLTPSGDRARGIAEVSAGLTPRRHGVTLTHRDGRSAYYLPVVWEQLSDPRRFVESLCRKAGVDPSTEGDGVTAEVNAVIAFSDA
jgi:AmmeMemoRadiSam system protein A